MIPLTLCLWKHWFWITKETTTPTTMTNNTTTSIRRQSLGLWCLVISISMLLHVHLGETAPIGAVDAKGLTFKKLALDNAGAAAGDGVADGKGANEKPNLPIASMVGERSAERKTKRINLNGNVNSMEADAVDEVVNGQEEISRIYVTLPTTTTTTTGATSSSFSSTTETSTFASSTTEVVHEDKKDVTSEAIEAEEKTADSSIDGGGVTVNSENQKEKESLDDEVENVNSTLADSRRAESAEVTPSARIIQVATNDLESEAKVLAAIPGVSIEEPEKKIDNQNIQNLVLQEEDVAAIDLNGSTVNRSRKSKGLIGEEPNKRSTAEGKEQPSQAEARQQSPRNLIQFNENDRMEMLNSQNHALTADDLTRVRSSNVGLISGISFSVLALFCAVSLVGAMMYRRRYVNKPQTLSEPDSSGYIDDSIIRVSVV